MNTQTKIGIFFLVSAILSKINISLNCIILSFMGILLAFIMLKLRHDFSIFPLYLITIIQGRNFKNSKDLKEIKNVLKLSDKGHVIEELFATPAWHPILSVESTNGTTWETLKKNLLKFIEYLPSKEKLREIAENESEMLISNRTIVDSKNVSKMTLKIFLKWIFFDNNYFIHSNDNTKYQIFTEKINKTNYENHVEIKSEETSDSEHPCQELYNRSKNDLNKKEFSFIDEFLTEEFLDKMYQSSIEYRKEIAIKGKGDPFLKQYAVDSIVNILKKSKFSELFNWEKPECYSILMQPFIISPMINMSDIAVLLAKNSEKYSNNGFDNFFTYLDFCLYYDHPFPVLERYDQESNTQYFIDLRSLKNFIDEKEGNSLNFGYGVRSCLGRFYAKEFIRGFFEKFMKQEELFKPKEGHLYSGRDNDDGDFGESVYQIKILFKVLKNEIIRNYYKWF